jgi:formate--tetrahydrofolate ligase
MEDFNLHLTGDVHAISLAHNLLAAMIDNSITHGNTLRIDPLTITWPRVVDVSDRALRKIVVGLGGRENGNPRETGFDISVASEVMAILGLTTSLKDFRQRLGRIVIGLDQDGRAVTAEQLGTAGAMAVLLKDTVKPTLLQTVENTPVFVHAGPFANIAHGNSSIIADLMGLKLADAVVTESGFGADMGMEKFMNIKCRYSGLVPDAVVMVCTVRALKMHSGRYRVVAGRPLDPGLTREDLKAVEEGCANLDKQIENARQFGVPVVVAINSFPTDTAAEVEVVRRRSIAAGAEGAYLSEVWGKGGAGGEALARAVLAAAEKPKSFRFTYELDWPIKQKIEAIASKIYGADGVDYLPLANQHADREVHRARLRQFADLHGEDASVDLARRRAEGTPERLPRADPRGARVDGRGLPLSSPRRDAHDAGTALGAQHVEDRPRRRWQRRRPVLRRGRLAACAA